MTVSMSTTFVANEVPAYIPVGTPFADHTPAHEQNVEWGRWVAVLPQMDMTPTFRDLGDVLRSSLSGVAQATLSALVGPLETAYSRMFSDVAAVVRSALRDVIVSSTSTARELSWAISAAQAAEIGRSSETEEDRRIYALAAVERLQRLLKLNQDDVTALIGVSRPTLWHWQQGRTPQERSLRHLYDVAGVVDLVVDSVGGEDQFEPALVSKQLGLDAPLAHVLATPQGPRAVLDRMFSETRRAVRPSAMPVAEELDLPGSVDDQPAAAGAGRRFPVRRARRRPAR